MGGWHQIPVVLKWVHLRQMRWKKSMQRLLKKEECSPFQLVSRASSTVSFFTNLQKPWKRSGNLAYCCKPSFRPTLLYFVQIHCHRWFTEISRTPAWNRRVLFRACQQPYGGDPLPSQGDQQDQRFLTNFTCQTLLGVVRKNSVT